MALTIESGITVEGGITAGDVPMTSIVTDGLVLYYDFSNPASYSGTGTVPPTTELWSMTTVLYPMRPMVKPVISTGLPM